jgi:hypothetical protein
MRGGQHQALALIEGLHARGHAAELLARPGSPLWESATVKGIKVRAARISTLVAESQKADIVHAHDAHSHTYCAFTVAAKLIVSRRVAFPVKTTPLSRLKYRRARRYLAVSRYVANRLTEAGIANDRIDVVYDGVSLDRSPAFMPDGPIVALASTDPEKGRDLVDQAARLCNARVLFSSDLVTDLPKASLFLYITRAEGLGSAALLAMSYGVPVIASRVGGLPEIVNDGETGRLTSNEPLLIAEAIMQLSSNRTLASHLAQAAYLNVVNHFTLSHMVEGTLRSYSLLAQ